MKNDRGKEGCCPMVDKISLDVPKLRVPHPGPKTVAHLERVRRAEGQSGLTFALSPETLVMERAQGWAVEDIDGNMFLDFVAGFGSLNAGHCHPRVVKAVQDQAVGFEEVAGLKGQEVKETAFGRLVGGACAALRANGSRCRDKISPRQYFYGCGIG